MTRTSTLLAVAVLALTGAGCATTRDEIQDQAGKTAADLGESAQAQGRRAVQELREIDHRDVAKAARGAIATTLEHVPLSKVRCSPGSIRRERFSAVMDCDATLDNGKKVIVPIRYTPVVGLSPGVPKIVDG